MAAPLHQRIGDIANYLTQLALERRDPTLGILAGRLRYCVEEAQKMRRTIDEYETDAAEDERMRAAGFEAVAELNAIVAAQGRPKV